MVKIWKVNIRLCNVLTLYLCTLFLVQGGKWTGYGLSRRVFVNFASSKRVLPDDDKRYAIETCSSSESVLRK